MYHKPFVQIDGNQHLYGEADKLPYKCAELIYEKLCTIADLLEGGDEQRVGKVDIVIDKLKALKIKKEADNDKKNQQSRQGKKPRRNKGKDTQAGSEDNGEGPGVREPVEIEVPGEAGQEV